MECAGPILVSGGVSDPTFFRGRDRTIVGSGPSRRDELVLGLLDPLVYSLEFTLTTARVPVASLEDHSLPMFAGWIGGDRPTMPEAHQVERVPAFIPGEMSTSGSMAYT